MPRSIVTIWVHVFGTATSVTDLRPACLIRVSVSNAALSPPIQLHVNIPGKATENGTRVGFSAWHVGDHDGASGSWFCLAWCHSRVDQQMKDTIFLFPLSLCLSRTLPLGTKTWVFPETNHTASLYAHECLYEWVSDAEVRMPRGTLTFPMSMSTLASLEPWFCYPSQLSNTHLRKQQMMAVLRGMPSSIQETQIELQDAAVGLLGIPNESPRPALSLSNKTKHINSKLYNVAI